jgi:hypothetical protein
MKTTLLAAMILLTGMAFGQTAAGVLSNQPQILRMPDHPMHAEPTPLASEHPLVGGGASTYTFAQGERPLWEFGPTAAPERPLGDVAREYRKTRQAGKKAEHNLEKQGS